MVVKSYHKTTVLASFLSPALLFLRDSFFTAPEVFTSGLTYRGYDTTKATVSTTVTGETGNVYIPYKPAVPGQPAIPGKPAVPEQPYIPE